MRRQQARRRRARQRILVFAVLLLAGAAVALGAAFVRHSTSSPAGTSRGSGGSKQAAAAPKPRASRTPPAEIRGVHVTMSLAAIRGKLAGYVRLERFGLNTIELDVKDESGEVAFRSPELTLANRIGAARSEYRPATVVRSLHRQGLYVIGRVVTFEDPILGRKVPRMAIRTPGGGVWTTSTGLAWTNPYSRAVWRYNVDIAAAAARAGFDEIMFDYVRFPSDGDVAHAVFHGRVHEPMDRTIARFLTYAHSRLHPLGVRVGAAVFGLAATQNLGIGQKPRGLSKVLDVIHPMVYPSHYTPGEFNLPDPNADPGDTVWFSLRDFKHALAGRQTALVPWLQDFSLGRKYTLRDVQAQIKAARVMGSSGFLLWNAAGVYTPDALRGR